MPDYDSINMNTLYLYMRIYLSKDIIISGILLLGTKIILRDNPLPPPPIFLGAYKILNIILSIENKEEKLKLNR